MMQELGVNPVSGRVEILKVVRTRPAAGFHLQPIGLASTSASPHFQSVTRTLWLFQDSQTASVKRM